MERVVRSFLDVCLVFVIFSWLMFKMICKCPTVRAKTTFPRDVNGMRGVESLLLVS